MAGGKQKNDEGYITQVYKFQKKFFFFTGIVISYRFLGTESENDNKNLLLALVFKIFSILVFYVYIH